MALRIAVFGSGAVLMALEILAFRLIAPTFGTAQYETTAVIGVFLIAMSGGYYVGGRIGDRWPRPQVLALPMAAAGLLILLVPTLDQRCSGRIADVEAIPLHLHALLASLVLFGLPTFLMACVSPIAIRLFGKAVEQTGKVAGGVSALSTMGSIFGTLFTGFYLIDALQSYERCVYLLGVTMLLLSGIAAFGARRLSGAALALAVLLVGAGSRSAHADVIFKRDSAYHRISVRDEGAKRILYFDNAPESQMELKDPASGGFEYTDFFHCAFLLKPAIKDVLFLGLGGGTGPKRFLHDYPNAQIDAVDVDPVVVEVAQKYFSVTPGPRLRLTTLDARQFVKRSPKQYDLIVLDAYTTNRYGSSIPEHLTTREFFGEVKKHLRPGGVVAYNVTGLTNGWGSAITRALLKTLATQFSTPHLFQAQSSYNTVILVVNGGRQTMDRGALVRRATELAKSGKVKLPNFVQRAGQGVAVPDLKGATLLTDDYHPVERLMRD